MKSLPDNSQQMQRAAYNTASFSASNLQRIDSVCIRFEEAWKSGQTPGLESYLDGFEDELRSALFTELLLLDIDYRLRIGQTPDPADYETRFPGETPAIESAFKSASRSGRVQREQQDSDEEPGDMQVTLTSRLQLRKFHAQGGLGVVYAADDENLGRRVAVKFPRRRSPGSIEQMRLAREAEITGRLEHPGIVPVYAQGLTDDGRPCYVMPFIDGQTMQESIREFHKSIEGQAVANPYETLAFRKLLQQFVAVCNAVAYSHEQQIIHRDIKPGNIMLGQFGETFLLDWGLAKSIANNGGNHRAGREKSPSAGRFESESLPEQTLPGQQIGTPAFASPEQVTGNVGQHDQRSDIYSLGATLYCILVGKGPIHSGDLTSSKSASVLRRVPRPGEIARSVPCALEAICLKAMAFEQDDRYQSAKQMANDVELYLADEPIDVLVETRRKRLRRWSRKHPRMVAALATFVLVAVTSLAIGSYVLGHQNTLLSQSNQDLVTAQQAQRLAQAETLATLRKLTDDVIERLLARKEELSGEDLEFVDSILQQYKRIANSQSDQVEAMELKIEGYFRVGQLLELLDKKRDAIAAWEEGLGVLADLPGLPSATLQNLTSKIQACLGVSLADTGDRRRGEAMIQSAVAAEFALLEAMPKSSEYRQEYANRLDQLGNVLVQSGDYQEAEKQFRKALEQTEGIADVGTQESLELRKLRAGAYHDLGLALNFQKKFEEAKTNLEISLQMHREVAEHSSKINHQLDLGRVLSTLGAAYRGLNELELAKANFNESVKLMKDFAAAYPSQIEPVSLIAISYTGLAGVDFDSGEYKDALSECEKAHSLFVSAMEKSPGEIKYQLASVETLAFQGAICEKMKRRDEAEGLYRESLVEAEKLLAADDRFRHRRQVIVLLKQIGSLCFQKNNFKEARELLGRALPLIEELGEGSARKSVVYDEVGCHQILGWCLMFTGQLEDAAEHWQRIVDLTDGQPIILQGEDTLQSARVYRALCIARQKPRQAMNDVQALARQEALVPSQIYNLSCAAAMASQYLEDESNGGEQKTAQQTAFELLERSYLAGKFKNAAELQALRGNPCFKTLLNHDEFKRIEQRIASSFK